MSISPPQKITVPFGTGGLKNSIPAAADPVTGNAGYSGGFPAINMTPKVAGGIPPFGEDFNGIFFDVTTALQFLEAGGSFPYDSTYATTVGGYPIGALISRSDNSGLWRNTVSNNTADPEGSGTGWQPEDAGSTAITMTNANVALTALQAARSMIIITGVLTANLQLIMPAYVKQWLIVNSCTGAFTITVKTAAGSGIAIATTSTQAVYGDGTNIGAYGLSTGRLLRTTIYRNNAGTLQSSVDGSAYANVGSTFTPHPLAVFAEGEALGGGASGANAAATGAGQVSAGPGGGGGGWSFIRRPIASFSGVTISVGAGGTSSANQAGGSSAIGALITAAGGLAVTTGPAATATNTAFGISDGGAGSGGDINSVGGVGDWALYGTTPQSGTGGSSRYGFGPTGVGGAATTGTLGNNAVSPGCGGSGAACGASVAAPKAGGAGAGGLVIIREYA